jgi:phosphoribosylglycinamide formyltransferase-1
VKVVLVASTGGSVADRVLSVPTFHRHVHSMVTDRECGAIDVAARHGVPATVLSGLGRDAFSDALLEHLARVQADYAVLFFTRLLAGEVLTEYRDRIVNLHGSVLPAFAGLDGFALTLESDAQFAGSTIHFIDDQMDEGKYILQSTFPLDRRLSEDRLRHRLFEQHCKGLVQVGAWLDAGRVRIDEGRVVVDGATFEDPEFSPGLDDPAAIGLRVPFPGEAPS